MENNKNIWLLPTNEPSRFSLNSSGKYHLTNQLYTSSPNFTNQNIYITSDEEIKEGDWYIYGERILQAKFTHKPLYKVKIILTTDTKLIADGVQAIPDEFLEWFVKNPSCERVEVKKGFADGSAYGYDFLSYKIIIPKVSKPTSMENKTPMQELIDELEQILSVSSNPLISMNLRLNIELAKSKLEKEKELFVNTFIDGEVNCGRQLAQDYYNEKFNKNE
jgi:hypothetical protein